MFKQYIAKPLLWIFLGGICLSFSSYNSYPPDVRPGVSEGSVDEEQSRNPDVAQLSPYEYRYVEKSNIRKGNWDSKQSWRHNRDAYLRGASQPQVYSHQHPHGPGGTGYDAHQPDSRLRKNIAKNNGNSPSNYANNTNQKQNQPLASQTSQRANPPSNQYSNSNQGQSQPSYDQMRYNGNSNDYDRGEALSWR